MIILIRGLSNSGKTSLARAIGMSLMGLVDLYHIDGDAMRYASFNSDYSDTGRTVNVAKVCHLAGVLDKPSAVIICSVIAPKREHVRVFSIHQDVMELYCTAARGPKNADDKVEMDPPGPDAILVNTDSFGDAYYQVVRYVASTCLSRINDHFLSENGGGI
jgi:hypothetical protein